VITRWILIILIIGINCTSPPPLPLFQPPELARVEMGRRYVALFWYRSVDEGDDAFVGYNVYSFPDSNLYDLAGNSDTLECYLVTEGPIQDSFYVIPNLSQDSIYYLQVRSVGRWNTISDHPEWRFVAASPRPEFTVTLEFNSGSDSRCALHFATGKSGRRSDLSEEWGDLWVEYDSLKDSIWFDSPDYGNQNCRKTFFENKGRMNFNDLTEITQDPNKIRVPIRDGDLVVAKTEDGNYVKIHVDEITWSDTTVRLTYAYQNIQNFPHFGGKNGYHLFD